MKRSLLRLGRVVGAVVLAFPLALAGCSGGGGGSGAYTTVIFTNVDPSASIVEVDFDFFDLSGIPDRVESVFVTPGFSVGFDFDQFESDQFFDVTLTWSDSSTTNIPLLFASGGEFTYPVAR